MDLKQPLATVAVVALMTSFGASTASASTITIMIDDFNVEQEILAARDGNPASSTVTGPEASIIGGVRHMKVETEAVLAPPAGGDAPFDPQQQGTGLSAEQGALSFSNASRSVGKGWVVYDGTVDRDGLPTPAQVAGLDFGASVNTTGLNADLLMGFPTGFFRFSAANFDHEEPGDLLFSAFAWDLGGRSVGYFEAIDPGDFSPILWYDDFRADWNNPGLGLGGFDFGNVGALAFRIESTVPAFDGDVGAITAHPIPLPASALLLLGGLGGLAGWSVAAKRRRKT